MPVNDFYALLVNKRELARGDRFHWTAPAYELLATTVVESVLRELGRTRTSAPGQAFSYKKEKPVCQTLHPPAPS